MAVTKLSAFPAVTAVAGADSLGVVQGGVTSKATASMVRGYLTAASNAGASGYAADTYLAGSAITIPTAGGWKVGTTYRSRFDMIKTAAGVAGFVITVRMGTLGTTGDAAILTITFNGGTAAADTGWFGVEVAFRTIGAGTAAVIQGVATCAHFLAATGLTATGASGFGAIISASAGFNSTTQTIIGLSVNGGTSFSGTNTLVTAELQGF